MCDNKRKLELNEKTQIFPITNGVDDLGRHFYLTDTGKVIKNCGQAEKEFEVPDEGLQKVCAQGRLEIEDIKRLWLLHMAI